MTPLILIPPSETKTPGGRGKPWMVGPRPTESLDAPRRAVIDALATAMHGELAARTKLLGVGANATEQATAANLAIDTAPTMAAIERYDGVLYGALDHTTLTPTQRRRLNAQVLIFSGVFGVVAPNDPVADYKCKMGATLAPLGKLARYWRPHLAPYLHQRSAGRVVWNLLPQEHDAAVAPLHDARAVIRVQFLDDVERGGMRTRVVVNHWNKLLKGSLVRHVLAHQLTNVDDLVAFDHPQGYRYEPTSTERDGNEIRVCFVSRR